MNTYRGDQYPLPSVSGVQKRLKSEGYGEKKGKMTTVGQAIDQDILEEAQKRAARNMLSSSLAGKPWDPEAPKFQFGPQRPEDFVGRPLTPKEQRVAELRREYQPITDTATDVWNFVKGIFGQGPSPWTIGPSRIPQQTQQQTEKKEDLSSETKPSGSSPPPDASAPGGKPGLSKQEPSEMNKYIRALIENMLQNRQGAVEAANRVAGANTAGSFLLNVDEQKALYDKMMSEALAPYSAGLSVDNVIASMLPTLYQSSRPDMMAFPAGSMVYNPATGETMQVPGVSGGGGSSPMDKYLEELSTFPLKLAGDITRDYSWGAIQGGNDLDENILARLIAISMWAANEGLNPENTYLLERLKK